MSYLSSFPFLHPQPVLCEGTSPGYKSRALAFRQRLQHLVQDSRTDLFRFLGAKKRIKTGRIFQKMEKRVNASSIPCSRCFPTLIGWHTSLRQLPGSTDTPRLLSARRAAQACQSDSHTPSVTAVTMQPSLLLPSSGKRRFLSFQSIYPPSNYRKFVSLNEFHGVSMISCLFII